MAVDEKRFHESLKQAACQPEFNVFQQALWHEGKGDWHAAHDLINDLTSTEAAWVHAYLHRKEGDLGMRIIGTDGLVKYDQFIRYSWNGKGSWLILLISESFLIF